MIELSKLKVSRRVVHCFSVRFLSRPDWNGSHEAGAYHGPQICSTEEKQLEDISRFRLLPIGSF